MQAASVKEEEQVRDETSGEMQHDGSASIEVPFDDTLPCMCLPEVLSITFVKPDQLPYPCARHQLVCAINLFVPSTCLCLCPVTQRS